MKSPARVTAIAIFLLACARTHSSGAADMTEADVEITGELPGAPPLRRLIVDLTLRNPGTARRLAFVERTIPAEAGGVDGFEESAADGVTFVRLRGRRSGYVFLLAPGARLTVRQLEIQDWRTHPAGDPHFGVLLCPMVMLDGIDATRWFVHATVVEGTMRIDARHARTIASTSMPGHREVTFEPSGARNVTLRFQVN